MSEYLKCPKCESDDFFGKIAPDDWEYGDGECWRELECDCGFSWREVYRFSRNETVGTMEKLDDKGDVIK